MVEMESGLKTRLNRPTCDLEFQLCAGFIRQSSFDRRDVFELHRAACNNLWLSSHELYQVTATVQKIKSANAHKERGSVNSVCFQ